MCEDSKSRTQLIIDAAKMIGHTPEPKTTGVINKCNCSCGWTSGEYFDGAKFALAGWIKHAKAVLAKS